MSLNEEGVTQFPGSNEDVERKPFRFGVLVNDDKLTIRLESRTTKHQWRTPDLRVEDFIDAAVAIPQATALDYACRFVGCLRADADNDHLRFISRADQDGSRILTLKMKLTLASFSVWLTYKFTLLSVVLESVDLLAAQVRDLQDELNQLKAERDHQPALVVPEKASAEFCLKYSVPTKRNVWVAQSCVDPERFVLGEDYSVEICKAGLYLVSLSVSHDNTQIGRVIEVTLDGKTARFIDAATKTPQKTRQTHLCFPVRVTAHTKLGAFYRGNHHVFPDDCFLDIIEL